MAILSTPALAVTEAEVEAQVAATGKETVAGNVLIWFLCAISFLKISQKIDSFMASLGVNVGHTGGSMLAEAMIVTRSIGALVGSGGRVGGFRGGTASGGSSSSGSGGFFKGGLAGMVSRKVTSDAVKTATSTTSAVHRTVTQTAAQRTASVSEQFNHSAHTDSHASTTQTASHEAQSSQSVHQSVHASAQQSVSRDAQVKSSQTTETISSRTVSGHQHAAHSTSGAASKPAPSFRGVGIGGAMFAKSLLSGGSFANDVIGQVARGDIRATGSITGDLAAQSLQSYMGYTALGEGAQDVPRFSHVEIGGGRITGTEMVLGATEGLAFGMYHADQYTAPQGDYTTVHSADGTRWYKQYAQDAVERKPYKAPDGTVAHHENIVKKLPDPPRRKDKL